VEEHVERAWFLIRRALELAPVLLVIGTAAYVIFESRTSIYPTAILLTVLVALVGLQALSEVIHRYLILSRIAHDFSITAEFVKNTTEGHLGQYFLRERAQFPDFQKRVADAREIWLLGTSLEQIVTTFFEVFLRKVKDGCKFRFLLMDPESTAVPVKSRGLFSAETPDRLKQDILNACRKISDLQAEQKTRNQVQLRQTSFVPGYAMILVDPTLGRGQVIVELYPYLVTADSRPHFELRTSDAKWYPYFCDQFSSIWNSSATPASKQNE
jgi:hypothetical protein